MRDLEASNANTSLTLFTKDDLVENESLTNKHICENLERFKTTGKIPQSVYQLFNFKRPYFMKVFLPRLLKICENNECNDSQRFLQALRTSLKIP